MSEPFSRALAGLVLAVLSVAGCSDGAQNSSCNGAEKCYCYANGTCNAGLTCASGRCVNLSGVGGAVSGSGGAVATGGGIGTGGGSPGTGGIGTCIPVSCVALGKNCGPMQNGCGATIDCGQCPGGTACSNNVCMGGTCTPRTNCGTDCGLIDDYCGGQLDCGPCGGAGCPTGNYSGPLDGNYLSAISPGGTPTPLTGTMAYTVSLVSGTTYQITNGSLTGTSPYGVTFAGTVTGTYDCALGSSNIQISGSYLGTYTFAGTASSFYDAPSNSFSGTWNTTESDPTYGGSGTFSAAHVP